MATLSKTRDTANVTRISPALVWGHLGPNLGTFESHQHSPRLCFELPRTMAIAGLQCLVVLPGCGIARIGMWTYR